MDKKEKYYHHVIKDMVRRTHYELDPHNESNVLIIFPMYDDEDQFLFRRDYVDKHTWNKVSDEDINFLGHTYGINKTECVMIMTRYWETLKPLIHSLWDY